MKEFANSLWDRAKESLEVAGCVLNVSPDATGSRAYYAAFYAVSAYFALHGNTFKKHSAVETAVHRDLVKAGTWTKQLGTEYSALVELRSVGDYGYIEHVSVDEAKRAIEIAGNILEAVAKLAPHDFTGLDKVR